MIKPIEYGFTADINAYMSASALEELATQMNILANCLTYKGAMQELENLKEIVKWHIDNLEDEYEPCYKDDPRFHDSRGS